MSENKNYTLIKTTPNDLLFDLHPVSNFGLTRRIYLNNKTEKQALPLDWALGVFQDDGVFQMYKQGLFTFDRNDEIVKAAFENGVYFGDTLDFTPAAPDQNKIILAILKKGKRAEINQAIEIYGKDTVKDVAILNLDSLTQGVVTMLESVLQTQFTIEVK